MNTRKVLNHTEKSSVQHMSAETNNDEFRTDMLAEIKKIQEELNELKNIKQNIVRKTIKEKPVKKTAEKKKAVKKKPVKKTAEKKKAVKKKPVRKTTKTKKMQK